MNKREENIINKQLRYLKKYDSDRVSIIRNALGINPQFTWDREEDTIISLYKSCLIMRKNNSKDNYFFASTSGWTVEYFRDKKKYKEGEEFDIKIYFSFVETDTYN
jgi:hypothetical protein